MTVKLEKHSKLAQKLFRPIWCIKEQISSKRVAKVEAYMDLDNGVLYICPVDSKDYEVEYRAKVSK